MKVIYITIGSISLVLGIVGIFLPLLPTTPFLLLTAFLYFRGSDRLYNWLIHHPQLGTYIRAFREEKALPLRAKVVSLTVMWASILYCTLCLIPLWHVKVFLWAVSGAVTLYILSLKTKKSTKKLR